MNQQLLLIISVITIIVNIGVLIYGIATFITEIKYIKDQVVNHIPSKLDNIEKKLIKISEDRTKCRQEMEGRVAYLEGKLNND